MKTIWGYLTIVASVMAILELVCVLFLYSYPALVLAILWSLWSNFTFYKYKTEKKL